MTEFSYVEADYVYKGFGQSHNIVSDEVTGYVYAVGSYERYDEYGDRTYEPCKGEYLGQPHTQHRTRRGHMLCLRRGSYEQYSETCL